jgi:hypothetical protein
LNSTIAGRLWKRLGQGGPWLAAGGLVALVTCAAAAWAAEEKPKDIPGSRFTHTHRVSLLPQPAPDAKPGDDLKALTPADDPPLPFSFNNSCNKCHEYATVSKGLHFNYMQDPKAVDPGRPGEPWFWTDRRNGTMLPLSYRPWPGTWRPEVVDILPWKFVQMFCVHFPGGGPGEMTETADPDARWLVSGKLEINCQMCHSGSPEYDQTEWYLQIAAQNFMWAGAASMTDLNYVSGAAKKMDAFYDPWRGPEDKKQEAVAPIIHYNSAKFDTKNRAFFSIPNKPPNTRCYYCHSLREVGPGVPDMWKTDQDVHMAAGLSCSDCHRSGLDHAMRRGYEGEPGSDDPALASLTCRGCHLGAPSAAAGPETMGGRLKAPVPRHVGLPTLHLKNLTCTTCHSGPRPGMKATRIQTSRGHTLEIPGELRGDDALPLIQNPVFARRPYDGLIGPQRMVWPSFWAWLEGEKITPLSPDFVYTVGQAEFEKKEKGEKYARLTPERIAAVLELLAVDPKAKGTPVYLSGGRLYQRNPGAGEGAPPLVASDHAAAAPVSWPIAHDVRPAARSLGSGGCTDCHGSDSPIFFGQVVAESPASLGDPKVVSMYELLGKDPTELQAWALSYQFRPFFKVVGFTTAGLIGAILLVYLLTGLTALARWAAKHAPQRQG